MPRDQKGKNRKFKHHKDKEFTEISGEQLAKIDRLAKGQKEEDIDQQQKLQKVEGEGEGWRKGKKKVVQKNYDMPPPSDSD